VVARYHANGNPFTSNSANPVGEPLLRIEHSNDNSHYGGWIGFRPTDPGRLYIAVGDGAGSNDLPNNGQNINTLLGKMLRIDVSGTAGYTIPAGNLVGGLPEIYQYGLRNPWRNSVDRSTGDLWIADVGQSAREEVNLQRADAPGGQNFGWRTKEGSVFTGLNPPSGSFIDPIYQYDHQVGGSITGGYVYRGSQIPALQGRYLFGDYVDGRIWSFNYTGGPPSVTEHTAQLDPDGTGPQTMAFQLASFGEDSEGELYMVALGRGAVYRIVPEPSTLLMICVASVLVAFSFWRSRTSSAH
jgi:glucose/arabinose dehydrogenase